MYTNIPLYGIMNLMIWGRHPLQKTGNHKNYNRGKIPMIKNICVIDNLDRLTCSTYPKRARQLVKKGRAEWLTEDTIKLISNNSYYEGESIMSNENIDSLNIDTIKSFIEKLANENSVAEKAIHEIGQVSNEDLKAARILEVVKSHDRAKIEIAAAFASELNK